MGKILEDAIVTEKDRKTFGKFYEAFTNNGIVATENKMPAQLSIEDLLTTPDATRFIPKVVETVVREALEPNLVVVPNVFEEVQLQAGRSIQIGSVGAIIAGEVSETGEYPERQPDLDGGDMVAVAVSKKGVMLRVSDEMITDSQWDVVGLWLRAAGRALARLKEVKGLKLLNDMGVTVFNNYQGGSDDGIEGTTTGRDITGAANGTMTLNDFFDMWTYLVLRGFNPDTLIVHPLAWKLFMTDTELREVLKEGDSLQSRSLPQGAPSPGWGTSHNGWGLRTTATGAGVSSTQGSGPDSILGKIGANPWVTGLNPLAATFFIPPRLGVPLRVLVTPYVRFDQGLTGTTKPSTSVILLDSSSTGVLVTRDPVETEEFDDPARDIRALKIRERYGFGLHEQGKSVAVARNILIDRNYNFENANNQVLTVINQASTLPSGVTHADLS